MGRFWCRGCGVEGDAIDYLRKIKKQSYHEARRTLGLPDEPEQGDSPSLTPAQARTRFRSLASFVPKAVVDNGSLTFLPAGPTLPARQEKITGLPVLVELNKWILPEVAWVCLDPAVHEPDPIPWPVILYDLEGREFKFNSAEALLALVDWDEWEFPPTQAQQAWLNSIGRSNVS